LTAYKENVDEQFSPFAISEQQGLKGVPMNISQAYILVSVIVLTVIVLFVIAVGKKGMEKPINKTLFAIGLLIVGVAAVLLLMDVIESGVAAVIGIVGIGLIAVSGSSNIKRMC
jgi:FtsH-binding integral membrane protein